MCTEVANEQWRNDPARKAAVRDQIQERQALFAEAREHLDRAHKLLVRCGWVEDDALLARCIGAVRQAKIRVDLDADQILEDPTDILLGNRAAFGSPVGWTAPEEGGQVEP